MPNPKDDFYDYDHLRFLNRGIGNRGLSYNSNTSTPPVKQSSAGTHAAHKFTSYYFDYSGNFTGLWGKYIGTWGKGSTKSYRQIDTAGYLTILNKFPRGAATPSDFAINIPGAEGKHLPSAGLIFSPGPNDQKIAEELFDNSKAYNITSLPKQSTFINGLYTDAKNSKTEKNAYIVLDHKTLTLSFVRPLGDEIISTSSTEVSVKLERLGSTPTRVLPATRTDYLYKQIIGMVHTHYFLTEGTVEQTTAVGYKSSSKPVAVTKMGYGVSAQDISDAKNNSFVNYAIDDRSIHRVNQNGAVKNNQSLSLDVLIDCLKVYSEMY